MTLCDCMKLLLKLTALMMFVFSTSSTKQCKPRKTERDGYVISNIGIKLCQLKCAENGQCLSAEYDIETLTCRLSRVESKKIKTKEGHVIFARDHSHVQIGSCTSSNCSFGQRCLKTRSGKDVCVRDEKKTYPEDNPGHSPLHDACRKGDLNRVKQVVSQSSTDINSRDEKHGRTPLMVAAHEGYCEIFRLLIRNGANKSDVDNDCKNVMHWACTGGHVGMVKYILSQKLVNVNARDKNGKTAAMIAKRRGNFDIYYFLTSRGFSK